MDNRYSAPDMLIMLKLKYKTLAYGTTRTNRKDWNSEILCLKKGERKEIFRLSITLEMIGHWLSLDRVP